MQLFSFRRRDRRAQTVSVTLSIPSDRPGKPRHLHALGAWDTPLLSAAILRSPSSERLDLYRKPRQEAGHTGTADIACVSPAYVAETAEPPVRSLKRARGMRSQYGPGAQWVRGHVRRPPSGSRPGQHPLR